MGPVQNVFGRMDCWMDAPGTKFDLEADAEVCLPLAPPKPHENHDNKVSNNFGEQSCSEAIT